MYARNGGVGLTLIYVDDLPIVGDFTIMLMLLEH